MRLYYGLLLTILPLGFATPARSQSHESSTEVLRSRVYEGVAILDFSQDSKRIELPDGKCSSEPPAVYGGRAYVSCTSGTVTAFSNTAVEMTYRASGMIAGTPAVTDRYVVVGSDAKFIYAFDRRSGKLRWKYRIRSAIRSSPLAAGGNIYCGSEDGKFYALDSLGKLKWSFDAKAPVASAAFDSGVVFVGTSHSTAFALEAVSGKPRWSTTAAGRVPCVSGSFVYLENRNGALIALDKHSGEERWRYDSDVDSSAFAVACSSTELAFACATALVVLDPATGQKLWDVFFNRPLCGAPMIVATAVYVPCSDWNIYAFDLATGLKLSHAGIGFAPWGSPAFGDGKIFYPNKQTLYILESK